MKHLILLLFLIPLYVMGGNGTWEKRINLLNVKTNTSYGMQEPARVGQDTKLVSKFSGYIFLDYTRKQQSDLAVASSSNFWRMWVNYKVVGSSTVYQLKISYENGNYIYSDYRAVDVVDGGYKITIDNVQGEYSTDGGSTWTAVANAATSANIPDDIDIRLELRSETVYALEPAQNADKSRLNFNTTYYRTNWSFVEGAEWYDLEWVYIDKYSLEASELTTIFGNSAQLQADYDKAFRLKAPTRVRVWGTHYTLDKAYEEGTIYFRVRSVSTFTDNGSATEQIKNGSWNYFYNPDYGATIESNEVVLYTIGTSEEFEPGKNWIYGVNFAEAGKSVSSVAFYDGSNRGRQSISYNTSDHVSLVGETKFDNEGRQSVSVIPAPVSGRQLGYRTNFNMATSTDVFDEGNFDFANPLSAVPPLYSPPSGISGAAQYFSTNNQFTTDLFRASIPNANGYVFSQTIYRNDGSGRIERIGGIGDEFKASGDHAVQTFYGSPTETELKRLFGSNVSDDPNGYRKEMVRDANGQYSVTYYDKRGNVIATALTGNSPGSLRPIEFTSEVVSTDMSDNNIVVNGNQIISEHTFLNAVVNNSVTFTYSLAGLVNTLNAQTITVGNQSLTVGALCSTCNYDLEIKVLKSDGTPVTTLTQSIDPASCTAAAYSYTPSAVTLAAIGEYRIIKTLTVDQAAMQTAFNTLLTSQGLDNPAAFIADYIQLTDFSSCFNNCGDYCTALWKLEYVKVNHVTAAAATTAWNALTPSQQQTYLTTCSQDVCNPDEFNEDFSNDLEDEMTVCDAYREMMTGQISPGGVFYDNLSSSFWSSVPLTIAGTTYTLAQLQNPDIYTHKMAEWLVDNGYHRESCHLNTCESWDNSNRYSIGLTNIIMSTPWSSTSTVFTQPYANDVYGWTDDPFIGSVFNGSSLLQTELANYMTNQYALYGSSGSWGCTGVTWPSSGSLITYVEKYVACMVVLNPAMTAAEIEQAKKHLFLGAYNQLKQKLMVAYKNANGCAFYQDEYAVFSNTVNQQDIQDNASEWTSNVLNPQDCDLNAWNRTQLWMSQLPAQCLSDLGMTQVNVTTGLLEPTYTMADLLTAYTTGGTAVNTLAKYFFAYSMKTCATNQWGWFYDPGTGNPGKTEYTAIIGILAAAPCGIPSPLIFETTAPAAVPTSITNQQLSDCFMDLVTLSNVGFVQLIGCSPCTSTTVNTTSSTYPQMFADCAVAPTPGNLVPGSLTITNSSGKYTLVYQMSNGSCRSTLPLYELVATYPLLSTSIAIHHIENPVKLMIGSFGAVAFDVILANGQSKKGFIYTKDLNCIDVGVFTTQTIPSITPGIIELPNYVADCIASELAQATIDATAIYNEIIANLQNQFLASLGKCLNVTETFRMTYTLKEYQYTLYYYDLAGNLVQTVPPQGVQILTSAQVASATDPVHTMETRYKYNGLNTLIAQYTPDGGRTDFYLDRLYRVRFAQDAQQASDGKSSYCTYDNLGRVVETGELKLGTGQGAAYLVSKVEDNSYPTTTRMDYTTSYYEGGYTTDASIAALFGTNGQENLRNAIGAIMRRQGDYDASGSLIAGTEVKTVLSYTYDVHKNVKRLVSTNYQLQSLGQQHKVTDYVYDLVSGNVNEVYYQTGKADEQRYRCHYDANNKLVRAFTSNDGVQWEMDAKYFYYLHGALARTEIGHDKVQGVDYAYNLQGWLKGVNNATLEPARDMGKDGNTSGLNKNFGRDAFGFQLGYYTNDYARIGFVSANTEPFASTSAVTALNLNPDASSAPMASLYNGNITHMVTAIRKDDESVLDILGNNYQYDQLQRIRDMKSYYASGLNAANSFAGAALYRGGAYRSEYTFDKNGNLLALKRNGSAVNDLGGTVPLPMDDFSYNYENGSGGTVTTPSERNRLSYVRDASANDANYQGDIKSGQVAGNYVYNFVGQLTADVQEGIEKIEWTVTGKVKSIKFTTAAKGNGKLDLKFIYDPMDRRVVKMVYNNDAHSGITYTYYSYDASGNPLAVYDRSTIQLLTPSNPRTFSDKYWIAEQTIYGSSRLGSMNPDEQIVNATITQPTANSSNLETGTGFTWTGTTPVAFDHSYRKVMLKRYELSNHLGNVLAVITDRKLEFGTTNTYTADVVQYSDYEPYGAQLQHRHYAGAGYRYGFQGQEMDDEIKGEGNSLNYEYRMHDPRIGRFFAVDPLEQKYPKYSPYHFSSNQPIHAKELEGLESSADLDINDPNVRLMHKWSGGGQGTYFTNEYYKSYQQGQVYGAAIFGAVVVDIFVTKGWLSRSLVIAAIGQNMNAHDNYQAAMKRGDKVAMAKYEKEIRETGYAIGLGILGEVGSLALVYGTKMIKSGWSIVQIKNFKYNVNTFGEEGAIKYAKGDIAREEMVAGGICFVAGTKIKTSLGKKDIDKIMFGDSVWSFNVDRLENELSKVINLFKRDSVTTLVRLSVNNQYIYTTEEHPFYVDGKWIHANELKAGYSLRSFSKEKQEISAIKFIDTLVTVYNFTVEGNHNYFVSDLEILAHNNGGCGVEGTAKGHLSKDLIDDMAIRGEYDFYGNTADFHVDEVFSYSKEKNYGFTSLTKKFEDMARAAGKTEVRIIFKTVVNKGLETNKNAWSQQYGYDFLFIGSDSYPTVMWTKKL